MKEDNALLDNIDPISQNITGGMKQNLNEIKHQFSGSVTAQAQFNFENIMKGLIAGSGTYVSLVYAYLHFVTWAIPGIGTIIAVISTAVALAVKNNPQRRDEEIENIRGTIAGDMRNNFVKNNALIKEAIISGGDKGISEEEILDPNAPYKKFPPEVQAELSYGLKIVRIFYRESFKATIEQQKVILEENYKRALAEPELSNAKRERIKTKAAEWRTKKITPLREDVTKAEQKITATFG